MNVVKVTTKDQLQEAYKIRTEVFVEEQNVPIEEEIDQHEQEAIHFVLYNQTKAVGAGRLRFVDGYGKIERICVSKEARGTGAGRQLMKAIEETAQLEGATKAKLNAQIQAQDFYHKLGYETVSGEFLDAGIPHVTMIKPLK
ncbi:GNAT family acetyltransferase YjcF [Halalkalibacter wakoensis JCM 9140]|uniref:GNAT family acetyltransferase YjcF n=1 Tax=Halalkalibacter wakoensis JCM 9140 TaxID=1236970 RepID=W4PYL5_9BACI|nr:GNAT family N-acetyltransferase [Halalkalibacter wakoensis]GAE24785.1 GNAT family acetyltransferase YjcF [Halalkalibacter wakoensis JCM 9140]